MKKETLKKIFDFLEENDNKKKPFLWKLLNNELFTEEELNVKGDLNLSDTNITSLPEGLKVKGNLLLIDCNNLTSLPKGLKVGGSLDLSGCKNLKYLPIGLKLGGFLHLSNCTSLISLPEGLKVKDLILSNCKSLTYLPKGLKVDGSLYIKKTALVELSYPDLLNMIGSDGYIKGKIVREYY